MLTGILRVFTKLRPSLRDRPTPLAILERQCARFERELLAAQARVALSTGEQEAAADHLSALYACGGGPVIGVASFMARRAPRLLSRAYQLRRACLRTSCPAAPAASVPIRSAGCCAPSTTAWDGSAAIVRS
jgi:hypothetical protein